jgi:hypothetical protein
MRRTKKPSGWRGQSGAAGAEAFMGSTGLFAGKPAPTG